MEHIGGAETKEGRERLMSSENISSNCIKFWGLAVGTNPRLIWIIPMFGVPARVETTSSENA